MKKELATACLWLLVFTVSFVLGWTYPIVHKVMAGLFVCFVGPLPFWMIWEGRYVREEEK